MKLKSVKVTNFRCLIMDEPINFESDVTVIVGENDSGKSSLIELLRIIIDNRGLPEPADFFGDERIIKCELDFGEDFYNIELVNENDNVKKSVKKVAAWGDLINYLEDDELISKIENPDDIKNILKQYGRTSAKRNLEPLRQELQEFLQNNKDIILNNEKEEIEIGDFPPILQVHFLGGQDFEDIDKFIKDVYLKDAFKDIWNYKIEGTNKDLAEILEERIISVTKDRQKEINEEVLPQVKEFFADLQELTIGIRHEPQDIAKNISVRTNFKDSNNNEIQFLKKGDGTKRRTTMALLRHKVEKEKGTGAKLFLFDEPDTHLHVKAQYDLVEIIEEIAVNDQIIVTSHSPFILNSMEPSKCRLFHSNNGIANVKSLNKEDDEVKILLQYLGIENTNLFFTRKILLVEGESEIEAIPLLFKKYKKRSLESELITIINAGGVDALPHLAKVIDDFMSDIPLFALVDNDIGKRPKTNELLEDLNEHKAIERIKIGYKEFEDAFEDSVLYEAVKKYKIDVLRETWTLDAIKGARENLKNNDNYDFSGKLARLSGNSKVENARAIAEYCNIEQIPSELKGLFDKIKPE